MYAQQFRTSTQRIFAALILAATILVLGAGNSASENSTSDPRNQKLDIHMNPNLIVGADACAKCHAGEVQSWKQTPHYETFYTLHRRQEAQQIADRLGIASFKTDSKCTQCHYTLQAHDRSLDAVAGVSCESCHGAAKNWVSIHNDYGGPNLKRSEEAAEHRVQRLRDSISQGMRNPINVYLLAQSCYRCHTVPDEALVNVGGHKAGSLDFEIVAWSQGKVRHNFVRSDGKANDPSSPERLRQMFVAGMIADLEFSLRATARATEKATFGVTSAQRAKRGADRLKAAQELLKQPLIDEILTEFANAKLKINNREVLENAAQKIHQLGVRFAATVDGKDLAAIERFIPKPDRWK